MKTFLALLLFPVLAFAAGSTPINNARITGSSQTTGTMDFTNATVTGLPASGSTTGTSAVPGVTLTISGTVASLTGTATNSSYLTTAVKTGTSTAPGLTMSLSGTTLTLSGTATNSIYASAASTPLVLMNGTLSLTIGTGLALTSGTLVSTVTANTYVSGTGIAISGTTVNNTGILSIAGSNANQVRIATVGGTSTFSLPQNTGTGSDFVAHSLTMNGATINVDGDSNVVFSNAILATGYYITGSYFFGDGGNLTGVLHNGTGLLITGGTFAGNNIVTGTMTGGAHVSSTIGTTNVVNAGAVSTGTLPLGSLSFTGFIPANNGGASGLTGILRATSGTTSTLSIGTGLTLTSGTLIASGTGNGTVTSFSTTLGGLSVATATTTPALSGTLTVPNGGTGIATLTGIPYGTGTAALGTVTIGSNLTLTGGTLSGASPGTGTVTSIVGDSNILVNAIATGTATTTGTLSLSGTLTGITINALRLTGTGTGTTASPALQLSGSSTGINPNGAGRFDLISNGAIVAAVYSGNMEFFAGCISTGGFTMAGDASLKIFPSGSSMILRTGGSSGFTIANTGDVTIAYGNLSMGLGGKTMSIKSGTNTLAGTFTLSSGAATVNTTAVDANTVIVCTVKTASGTLGTGSPEIVITSGTGFTASGAVTDNSTYNWLGLKVN